MKIDEFEFQDKNGNEIEPTKNQLVIYIKSLHKQIKDLEVMQNQVAINELEKIRQFIVMNDKYDEEIGCNIIETFDLLEDIKDRIKKLGGGDNE